MNIENISKEKGEVLVRLSKDDLVGICNALYRQTEEQENKENILQLYSDMMMARDLCQYGHIDDFCLQNIVRCRSGKKEFYLILIFNPSMRILRTIIFRTHLKIPTGFGFISALSGILDAVIHWQNG